MKLKSPVKKSDDDDDQEENEFLPPWLVDETGELIIHMFYMLQKNKFYGMDNPQQMLIGPAFTHYVKTGEVEDRHVEFWKSVNRWYRLSCKKRGSLLKR